MWGAPKNPSDSPLPSTDIPLLAGGLALCVTTRAMRYQVGGALTLEVMGEVARRRRPVELSDDARARMDAARALVDGIERGGDQAPAVCGVNTGFGFLADARISAGEGRALRRTAVRSHAAGGAAPR